jgi:hypothetical protein
LGTDAGTGISLPAIQGKLPWLSQAVDAQFNIKCRPVEMILMEQFNLQNLVDRCIAKPGEIITRQKILLVSDKDP